MPAFTANNAQDLARLAAFSNVPIPDMPPDKMAIAVPLTFETDTTSSKIWESIITTHIERGT